MVCFFHIFYLFHRVDIEVFRTFDLTKMLDIFIFTFSFFINGLILINSTNQTPVVLNSFFHHEMSVSSREVIENDMHCFIEHGT